MQAASVMPTVLRRKPFDHTLAGLRRGSSGPLLWPAFIIVSIIYSSTCVKIDKQNIVKGFLKYITLFAAALS